MKNVNLDKWRGRRDAFELEPETTPFREQPAPRSCAGCCFEGQWAKTCQRAAEVAVRAGMRDCDHGVIYKLVDVDPRQQKIEGT